MRICAKVIAVLLVYKRVILAYMLLGRQQTDSNSRRCDQTDYLVMVQALASRRFQPFLQIDDSSISLNRFSHTQSGNQRNITTPLPISELRWLSGISPLKECRDVPQ